jgi:ribosome-binding protein aMBF1 (putative translation factor)
MRLTAEQQEQLQRARAAHQHRVYLEFTPEQRAAWQQAASKEQAGKAENIAHFRRIESAAQDPGFFGDIRRAILISQYSPTELATNIGIDPLVLSDFRAGEAELPASALSRLIEVLGLRLIQEIPH